MSKDKDRIAQLEKINKRLVDSRRLWVGKAQAAISENAETQHVFDVQWKADQRAIKRWQKANPGNELVWPDRADMVVFLMGELDKLSKPGKHDIAIDKAELVDLIIAAMAFVNINGALPRGEEQEKTIRLWYQWIQRQRRGPNVVELNVRAREKKK